MTALTYTSRPRLAALRVLDTPIGASLGDHVTDTGGVLTVNINADVWSILSSGERVLVGVLEEIAGQRTTTTWTDICARLDDDCKASVVSALAVLCGLDATVTTPSPIPAQRTAS